MKKSNFKNAQKLSREAQKFIVGQGKELCPPTGCYNYYLSDGNGTCIVAPCNSDYGTVVQVDGRSKCCF
ncbi:hypothetical protein [Chryseobacterium contaminans]|uniref:hypothetical protein n=1 Tax=Chryseobacterium contaminans TaxID=1423959 RepID=UPI0030190138